MKFKEAIKLQAEALQEAESSDENYNATIKDIEMLLKSIQKQVKNHQKKQKSDPKNWGFTGDVSTVKDALLVAANTLG